MTYATIMIPVTKETSLARSGLAKSYLYLDDSSDD